MSILKRCSSCDLGVIPTKSGDCPSCRQKFVEAKPPDVEKLISVPQIAIETPAAEPPGARNEPARPKTLLETCYWCETKVIPTSDDHCPACRRQFLGPKAFNLLQLEKQFGPKDSSKLPSLAFPKRERIKFALLSLAVFPAACSLLLLGILINILFSELVPWIPNTSLIYSSLTGGAVALAGSLAGVLIRALWFHAKRYNTQGADTLLGSSTRPYVLLLRSFEIDADGFFAHAYRTLDQEITSSLKSIGPVIAAGKPGESRPPLGAARAYLTGLDWKEAVVELIQKAGVVVIIPGLSKGVVWETLVSINSIPPERILIALPQPNDSSRQLYEDYRYLAREIFPKRLPDWDPECRFIHFGSTWEPHLVRLEERRAFFRSKKVLPADAFDLFEENLKSLRASVDFLSPSRKP